MDGNDKYIQIEGSVSGLVYTNEENGYTVLRLKTADDTVTAVGCIPEASVGEQLLLTGQWTTHPSYGSQFKAERVERSMPNTKQTIYDYLAFGAVKGVGPTLAAAIVTKFGTQTFEILENEPERLAEISGISEKKAQGIGREFKRRAGMRLLMEFLAGYGLRPQYAVGLYKCYGEDALEAVSENPYILTGEYFGADFFEADTLAVALGMPSDAHQRVEAAVMFELSYNLDNGHSFIPYEKLAAVTDQLIGVGMPPVEEAIAFLTETGYIVRETVAGEDACYLERLYSAENYVAQRIKAMASVPPNKEYDTTRMLDAVEKRLEIQFAGLQRQAVEMAAENGIMVLTGGPGTGKTTAVCAILALFDRLGLETALAAPTGRAAKRMSELTGREAFTVHRLLGAGFSPEASETVFEKDENEPLNVQAVILDETSMVDVLLMSSLLKAMRPGCRLVMVGDSDQLPPVGPGAVFSDVIRSGVVPTVKLTEIFRQAKESRIVKNAHIINQGLVPDLSENKGDFFFLQRSTPEKTVETIVELCAERLPKKMGFELGQIQVLSPVRKRDAGTISLNKRLQAVLNPPSEDKKEKEYGDFLFREGDRVMQIRNNYDILWKKTGGGSVGSGIFNGDIGRVLSIDSAKDLMTVDFEDKIAEYPFDSLSELEPAYAMTVHKSQGSEFPVVILSATKGSQMLMTRGVLYTAVTRAREMLIIVGDGGIVEEMAKNDRRQRRYSGLRARLSDMR